MLPARREIGRPHHDRCGIVRTNLIERKTTMHPGQFKKLKRRVKYILHRYILGNAFKAEVRRWKEDDGDNTYRLSYDLGPQSVVFDLGGYVGDFANAIHCRTGATVYLFEPGKMFFEKCLERFRGNSSIKLFNFGLGDKEGDFMLSESDDASAISASSIRGERVLVKRFSDVYGELGLSEVDLLKINIEGGEFEVIPHLIETGLIQNINHLQVQFHNFVPGAERKRDDIVRALEKTHQRDWCYPFVWESWSRRA